MSIRWTQAEKELLARELVRLRKESPRSTDRDLFQEAQQILPGDRVRNIVAISQVRDIVIMANQLVNAVEAIPVANGIVSVDTSNLNIQGTQTGRSQVEVQNVAANRSPDSDRSKPADRPAARSMPVPLKPVIVPTKATGIIPEIQAVLKALPEPSNWWKSLRTVTAGLATIVESEEWRTKHGHQS